MSSTTIGIVIALLVVLLTALGYFALGGFKHANPSIAANTVSTPATSSAPIAKAAPQSPADLKEMLARDDYATKLSKALHQRLPEYKSVTIFADNWSGNHAPKLAAPRDAKLRTGDNLMLVFWSPASGTARSLSEFTKSRAAQEAIGAGFAEFQFVDPSSYCFSLVAPVSGAGPVSCGIR